MARDSDDSSLNSTTTGASRATPTSAIRDLVSTGRSWYSRRPTLRIEGCSNAALINAGTRR